MKGYFGIGIEGASKMMNMGNLVRSAHALVRALCSRSTRIIA